MAPAPRWVGRWCATSLALALTLAGGCKGRSASGNGEETGKNPAVALAEVPAGQRGVPDPGTDLPGVAVGARGAVSSAELNASRVGLSVLERGGNAVDAAVAVGLALSVTHPSAGNIGGGGFMVVREASGRARAIDYRETAPGAASRDMYLDGDGNPTNQSRVGALAAGIPGDVAGFARAHALYGTMPWRELVMPAVASRARAGR